MSYKHISIFTLEDKTLIPQFIEDMTKILTEGNVCFEVYKNLSTVNMGPVHSGDLMQIITFNTREEMDNYPASDVHQKLFAVSPAMSHVEAFDHEA